jgi:hypothetical protein
MWQCLAGLLAAFLVVIAFDCSELGFQVAAGLLQLFGVGTVALGIRQTRRQFGRPGVLAHALEWARSFPPVKTSESRGSVATTLSGFHAAARGYGWRNAPAGASAEDRLVVVEENLSGLLKRFDATEKELRDAMSAQKAELETEKAARAEADREISGRLEAAETGGLTLSMIGTVWIVVGIVLGTMPAQFSALVR